MVNYKKNDYTGEEIIELVKEYQKNKDKNIMDKIIESQYGFVCKIAKENYTENLKYIIDYEELVNQGVMGVYDAVKKFEPEKDYRFSTYAYWWIMREITDYVNYQSNPYYMGKHRASRFRKYMRFVKNTDSRIINEMTDEEMSKELDIELSYIKDFRGTDFSIVRLDAPVKSDEDDSINLCDYFLHTKDEYEDIDRLSARDYIFKKMDEKLTEQQKFVIINRYGFNKSKQARTLESIGDELGVSRERIRQVENKAIEKLQQAIKNDGLMKLEDFIKVI